MWDRALLLLNIYLYHTFKFKFLRKVGRRDKNAEGNMRERIGWCIKGLMLSYEIYCNIFSDLIKMPRCISILDWILLKRRSNDSLDTKSIKRYDEHLIQCYLITLVRANYLRSEYHNVTLSRRFCTLNKCATPPSDVPLTNLTCPSRRLSLFFSSLLSSLRASP